MNYTESIEYINELTTKYGISMGLSAMRIMTAYFRHPEKAYKVIHIAGTNGKGSVGAFVANILCEAGYKVGRYVSPSVTDYCDKIQFIYDGKTTFISEEEVAHYITTIRELIDADFSGPDFHPTPYEVETMMALLAFKDAGCNYAVVECGMGGRDDATNIIDNKELCIFTPVSLEHTAYLGDTLGKIADNKSDILRAGCPAVSAVQPGEVREVFDKKQADFKTVIRYPDKTSITETSINGTDLIYNNVKWHINMAGSYQAENASLAILAVNILSKGEIPVPVIQKGLGKTKWPARFEVLSKDPVVLFDGAHNPHGVRALINSLNSLYHDRNTYKRRAIFGVFADKDIDSMRYIPLTPQSRVEWMQESLRTGSLIGSQIKR